MTVVHTRNLCLSYGPRRGVQNVNLQISAGEIFGFLGPNGAGKTTTIRILLGFLKSGSGSASVLGMNCWTDSDRIRLDVGYVAGDVRLYPWLTTRRALTISGQIRHRDVMTEGLTLADRFRLEVDLPVRKMSRGNRQKVALVLALAHRPKLLILDEPTSGLDPLMQDTLCDCLREMAKEGRTVFFSSHSLSEVESLCDRIAIVREGAIVADETIASLKSRAPRIVTMTLAEGVRSESIAWPEGLTFLTQFRQSVRLQLVGSATEFVCWAAQQNPADVAIGTPNLEELFRSYYRSESEQESEEAASCAGC